MNKDERQNKIVEVINKKKKISVVELSDIFNVSTVTIRKDLSTLADQGIIKKTHNYAELLNNDNISRKLSYHFIEKTKIANKAIDLVDDNDTIMIESGSCCAIFAKALTENKKNLTIITNSVFIADYIGNKPDFQIILIGGIYQQSSQVLIGPILASTVKNYKVDKLFIGTDGYSYEWGFSNKDAFRGEAVRHMASRSNKVVILTESEKFEQNGTLPLGIENKVHSVVTDKNINKNALSHLQTQGIKVIFS
ncbi:DeoR/GlpR family DNA-binding transcription regulator [uncultured Anaerococcus sp.]|uniref:DeoR/GlpR family DNA-binding transcription regulator n=1 Tax=uncultured Anaerococcus sp. TaxID=293428 RepID=UPI0026262B19|nr:DeoR/GlpR family DNA-binding transcription regulator [uncultured Anaerococcus sp.]